jgi:four helix bundle protein
MGTDNTIVQKSKAFAIRIIRLYQFLTNEKKEFVLSKQLLRSGTSVGANVKEAIRGFSKKDFRFKLGIALKEASESEYWLELLVATDYISETQFQSLEDDCVELIKILTAILNSSNDKDPNSEQN